MIIIRSVAVIHAIIAIIYYLGIWIGYSVKLLFVFGVRSIRLGLVYSPIGLDLHELLIVDVKLVIIKLGF